MRSSTRGQELSLSRSRLARGQLVDPYSARSSSPLRGRSVRSRTRERARAKSWAHNSPSEHRPMRLSAQPEPRRPSPFPRPPGAPRPRIRSAPPAHPGTPALSASPAAELEGLDCLQVELPRPGSRPDLLKLGRQELEGGRDPGDPDPRRCEPSALDSHGRTRATDPFPRRCRSRRQPVPNALEPFALPGRVDALRETQVRQVRLRFHVATAIRREQRERPLRLGPDVIGLQDRATGRTAVERGGRRGSGPPECAPTAPPSRSLTMLASIRRIPLSPCASIHTIPVDMSICNNGMPIVKDIEL